MNRIIADALAAVDRAQAETQNNWSRGADDAELWALRALAEAVRNHVSKPLTMTTAGGYKVQTVSTVDRGQYYRVTRPNGVSVPLNPWNPKREIRTFEQLAGVLAREGEDAATLE